MLVFNILRAMYASRSYAKIMSIIPCYFICLTYVIHHAFSLAACLPHVYFTNHKPRLPRHIQCMYSILLYPSKINSVILTFLQAMFSSRVIHTSLVSFQLYCTCDVCRSIFFFKSYHMSVFLVLYLMYDSTNCYK